MRPLLRWSIYAASALLAGCGDSGPIGELEDRISQMSPEPEGALWQAQGLIDATLLKGYGLALADSSRLDLRFFRCDSRDSTIPTIELCDAGGKFKWQRAIASTPIRQIDVSSIAVLTGEHAGATTYALTFACDFDQYCQDGLWLANPKPLLPCKNEASCSRLEAELAPLVALARGEPFRQFARDRLLQAGPVADRSAARARLGLINTLVAGSIGGEGEISSTGSLHLTDDLGLTLISYVCANPTGGDRTAVMEACRSRKPFPDRQVFVLPAAELARIVVDSPSVEQSGRDVVLLCDDDAPCFDRPVTTMRPASTTDAFIVNCLGVDDCAAIARGLRDIAAFVASTFDPEGAPSDEVQSLAADTSPSETPVEVVSAEEAEKLYGISKQDFVPQIDYPDELKPLAARAGQGDAEAQFQLGMQHLNGIGLPHYIHAESPGGAGTSYEISRNYFAAARWLGAAQTRTMPRCNTSSPASTCPVRACGRARRRPSAGSRQPRSRISRTRSA
jgi:hypothetical protein